MPRGRISDRQDRDGGEHRHLSRCAVPPLRRREGPGAASPGVARRPRRGGGAIGRRARAVDHPPRSRASRSAGQGGAGRDRLGRALENRAVPVRASLSYRPTLRSTCEPSGAVLVGIDSLNIDDIADPEPAGPLDPARRPGSRSSSTCVISRAFLRAGFRFSAVPAKVAGFGSWPVRAFGHVLPSNHRLRLSRRRSSIGRAGSRRRPGHRNEAHQSPAPARPRMALAQRPDSARAAASGTSYVETADSGGWDECFPTVVPVQSRCSAGTHHRCPITVSCGARPGPARSTSSSEGTTLAGSAQGSGLSLRVSAARSPWIPRSRWSASGIGSVTPATAPFPWIWSSHPLLNVQPGSEFSRCRESAR